MSISARVVVVPREQAPLRVEEVTLPDPGPTQVVISQFASGICHSQLHRMRRQRNSPILLGHESTGVVLQTGAEVTHVKEGDTVLVTWVPRNAAAAATLPLGAQLDVSDGTAYSRDVFTWADNTIADEQYVVKIDPGIRKDVTSIVGCAVMTGVGAVVNTVQVQPGQSVAVFGVGGVGLCAVMGARIAGADPIIAVDIDDGKLAFAKTFGATHGVNAAKVDPVDAIRQLTPRAGQYTFLQEPVAGVDFAFDCIGIRGTIEQIVSSCRGGSFGTCGGGTAVLVGVPTTSVEISAREVLMFEKRLVGSFGGSCVPERDLPRYLEWYRAGDLDLESLVTARYTLDQINEATTALANGEIRGRAILMFRDEPVG